MKYIIIRSLVDGEIDLSTNDLQNRVNSYLKKGYVPQGGIAIAYDSFNGNSCIMQAMVKKRK